MTENVEITKSGSENSMQMIRKFTRRVQSMGLVKSMRNRRYRSRSPSQTMKKKQALRRLERAAKREQLIKEGKITERPTRGSRGGRTR